MKLLTSGLALFCTAACAEMLNIDEAYVDANLSGSAGGSGAPSSGANAGGGASQSLGGLGAAPPVGDAGARSEAGAGGSGAEGGGAGGSGDSLCAQYCDAMGEYCTENQLQYVDRAQCLRVCNMFEPGEVGVADDNTVACRLRYAGKARPAAGEELAEYCRQAGPGGDGSCGSNCDGLCTVILATCQEALTPYFYRSMAECQADCKGLPEVPYVYGGETVGNTLQCRLYHATYAAILDPEEHCEHALGVTTCEPQAE